MLPDAAASFSRVQQARVRATLLALRREWARMGDNFDESWRTVGPRMTVLLAAAQQGASRDGVNYVERVLAELNQDAPLEAQPVPGRLVGAASDGRPLASLLFGAVTTAKDAIDGGTPTRDAFAQAQRWLNMVAWTQVSDAGRGGIALSMFARPQLTGFVRAVNPPCCKRCAILAGKWFRLRESAGFDRHPRCDCYAIPAAENIAGDLTTDPQALLEAGQVKDLTQADRDALDAGESLQTVVNNARMQFRNSRIESLYPNAPSRRYAIRILREQGYLT